MSDEQTLLARIAALTAENLELRFRAGDLPTMPRNQTGLPFSGARLITARHRRDLTVKEVADHLGVDKRTYIGYESELIAPAIEQINDLAMFLHFMPDFFFCACADAGSKGFHLIDPATTSLGYAPLAADELHVAKWYG